MKRNKGSVAITSLFFKTVVAESMLSILWGLHHSSMPWPQGAAVQSPPTAGEATAEAGSGLLKATFCDTDR